jgi:hypothetical protein
MGNDKTVQVLFFHLRPQKRQMCSREARVGNGFEILKHKRGLYSNRAAISAKFGFGVDSADGVPM